MSKENNMISKALYWIGYHRTDIRQRLRKGAFRPYYKGRNAALVCLSR